MSTPTVHQFIRELDASNTHYSVTSVREGAIMLIVTLPGERWEVEFFDDREPEVEVFRSDGTIFGPELLVSLRDEPTS
ncbi:hypothetical protein [uncultured Sphingomonas sp.]|uniref:hypothetical protein n=1 Tax=uncultured Sphingomonas sp. TaxID=158754 RepID=UPI0025FD9296|nr:hypothetical protein [uncultured Sphingomonas sp.]